MIRFFLVDNFSTMFSKNLKEYASDVLSGNFEIFNETEKIIKNIKHWAIAIMCARTGRVFGPKRGAGKPANGAVRVFFTKGLIS